MQFVNQDLTEVEGPAIIAHGVNCQNVMGSGVAKALYTKWPRVKESYHKLCKEYPDPLSKLGFVGFTFVELNTAIYVANCFTQEHYGREGRKYADLAAVLQAMKVVALDAINIFGFSQVHIPKIGCGLGGLDWETEVKPVLLDIEEKYEVEFIVHTI